MNSISNVTEFINQFKTELEDTNFDNILKEYAEFTESTSAPYLNSDRIKDKSMYPVFGLIGEIGEFAEKHTEDTILSSKAFEYASYLHEAGDILWYLMRISHHLNIPSKNIFCYPKDPLMLMPICHQVYSGDIYKAFFTNASKLTETYKKLIRDDVGNDEKIEKITTYANLIFWTVLLTAVSKIATYIKSISNFIEAIIIMNKNKLTLRHLSHTNTCIHIPLK